MRRTLQFLQNILKGLDLWGALLVTFLVAFFSPRSISNPVAEKIYGVGISVLSIIFAVYFTALAVIIAAGDDDFVAYLQDMDVYETLIHVFRFILWLLFVALLASVMLFVLSVLLDATEHPCQAKWWMVVFAFLFSYALFATMSSTHHAFNYARFRVLFLQSRSKATPSADPPPPTD